MYAILFDNNMAYLESIKTKYAGEQFLMYRGRLFERVKDTRNYVQRQYVEIY